jgi:hypothetical protein
VTAPVVDLSFPRRWEAEILAARPLILPPRHFVYPREAEEVERGALEILVRPNPLGAPGLDSETWENSDSRTVSANLQPFLATCALGFRDPAVPTGLWSAPRPAEICAVSGGYAYLIDTGAPERFTMIPYRPVLEVRPVVAEGLLVFVGHHSMVAWGWEGQAWQTAKLSDEGVAITGIADGVLRGRGWEMISDRETSFALDLRTGQPA